MFGEIVCPLGRKNLPENAKGGFYKKEAEVTKRQNVVRDI